jgi:hypothetical protein
MLLFGRDGATTLRYVTQSPTGVAVGSLNVDDGVKDDSWHTYEVFEDAGTAEGSVSAVLRVDGVAFPSGTVGVPAITSRDANNIGRGPSSFLAADIAEIILLSRKLEDPMRNAIEAYLRNKWKL